MTNLNRTYSSLKELQNLSVYTTSMVKVNRLGSLLVTIMALVFLLVVLILIFVPWVQTAIGSGRVIGFLADDRIQDIQAPVDGRVDKWFVVEGSSVKAGDSIVQIVDLDPQIVDRINQEKNAAELKLKAAVTSKETSKKNLERQKSLFQKGLSSARALELAELEYQKFLSEESVAIAELTRIETRLSRQVNQTVVAPRNGVIQRILIPQGEGVLVKAGTILASLVPETDELAVELKIRGNDMPLVRHYRDARLQFEGWPAIQIPGWPNVAIGTFPGKVKFVDPSDDGTGNFRVIITPEKRDDWPDNRFIRQGVRVNGWIQLDTVSLGWEIWRQLNGFPPLIKEEK